MNCPNCGKPSDPEQQFCRACGMSLETVSKLVAQHSSSSIEVQNKSDKVGLEAAIVRSMFNWIMLGMIFIGLGLFLMIVNKYLVIGKELSMVSAFIMLSGVGVAAAGLFKAIKQGTQLATGRQAAQIHDSPDAKSLPNTNPIPAALPSVTERTTQLIAVEEAPTNKMMDTKARE